MNNIVKELRKKKGIQQKELARIINVSRPTICDWEANRKNPSGERLRKLAEYFDVDELVVLGVGVPSREEKEPEENRTKTERTLEAQIIANAIDKLPKKQRMIALNVLQAMFVDFDCF